MFELMLSMQAAGMITDWLGTKNQQQLAGYGQKIQEAGIEANIQQTRTESEDASLQAMKSLRQNLGSQIAVQAARGTKAGAGSAYSAINESVSNFNSDESMRKINLLGKENQLRGGAAMSRFESMTSNNKLWQGFSDRTINRFPSSTKAWKQGIADFKEGFGLTGKS